MGSQIIAFVFARGGSKGLPNKNILSFAGKPLISHAINIGLNLSRVKKVVVSTDNLDIAEISRNAGAVVPFLRPAELATDTAPEWLAWQHAIQTLQKNGEIFDIFLSLPATAPLRNIDDINCCIDALLSTDADIVITINDAMRSPYFNMARKNERGEINLALNGKYQRRQDAPVLYDITTVAYVARTDYILRAKGIFDGKVRAVKIPQARALDIDTALDFTIGEFLSTNISVNDRAYLLK